MIASITCPICDGTAPVRRGRVLPHDRLIRGWGEDATGERVMADITVTCAPKIKVRSP